MKLCPPDALMTWLAAESAIRDSGNKAAVLDAQSWAAHARSYATALTFVLTAMKETVEYVETRTDARAGGNPDELAERVAVEFDHTAELLGRLGRGNPS
jgi:hypothetical protein